MKTDNLVVRLIGEMKFGQGSLTTTFPISG